MTWLGRAYCYLFRGGKDFAPGPQQTISVGAIYSYEDQIVDHLTRERIEEIKRLAVEQKVSGMLVQEQEIHALCILALKAKQ